MDRAADQPRFVGAVDLLRRCGAQTFRIEYTDPENGVVVWTSVAQFPGVVRCAADVDPLAAVHKLCEAVIDGGECAHCRKCAAFEPTVEGALEMRESAARFGNPVPTCMVTWDEVGQRYAPECQIGDRP
jgi:hypothetical protein